MGQWWPEGVENGHSVRAKERRRYLALLDLSKATDGWLFRLALP